LTGQIERDPVAKLLIAEARTRSDHAVSARDLLLGIRPETIPKPLRYAYAVTSSIVALSGDDAEIRRVAIRAIRDLPSSIQEADETVRKLLHQLSAQNPSA
jgi:hypothetical protein